MTPEAISADAFELQRLPFLQIGPARLRHPAANDGTEIRKLGPQRTCVAAEKPGEEWLAEPVLS